MNNFKDDILFEAHNEKITQIVIGDYFGPENSEAVLGPDSTPDERCVMSWDEAAPYLDYEFDTGLGSKDCHAITAWTATKVIFVSCYDGSTDVCSIPRNPEDHLPKMYGGG